MSAKKQRSCDPLQSLGWVLLIVILILAFNNYRKGLTRDYPQTFDEGLHLWMAHHLLTHPDDYSARELVSLIEASGQQVNPSARFYLTKSLYKHPPLFVNLVKLALPGYPWAIPALMGCLVILFAYLFGRLAYGAWTGLLAGFFLFLDPNLWINAQKMWMGSTLAAFVMIGTCFFLRASEFSKGGGWFWYLAAGLAWGLAANVKYAALVPFLGVILYAVLCHRGLWMRPRFWIMPFVLCLVLLPWIFQYVQAYGFQSAIAPFGGHTASRLPVIQAALGFLLGAVLFFLFLRFLSGRIKMSYGETKRVQKEERFRIPSLLQKGMPAVLGVFFLIFLLLAPSFRERVILMLSPAALPSSSFQIGFFQNEGWDFYFGRFLELSPLYLFSYLVFFLPLAERSPFQRADLLLLIPSAFFLFVLVLWQNYQSRYALSATVLLMILASRVVVGIWNVLGQVPRPALSLSLRAGWLGLVSLAAAKTLWVDLKFVLPNAMAYY